jgi:hypothetical protein
LELHVFGEVSLTIDVKSWTCSLLGLVSTMVETKPRRLQGAGSSSTGYCIVYVQLEVSSESFLDNPLVVLRGMQ